MCPFNTVFYVFLKIKNKKNKSFIGNDGFLFVLISSNELCYVFFIGDLPHSVFPLIYLFYLKNNKQHNKFIVLGHESTYFVKHKTKGKTCYTEFEVINLLELFIGSIFVEFGGHIF